MVICCSLKKLDVCHSSKMYLWPSIWDFGYHVFSHQIFNALLKVLENNFQLPPHHHLWSPPLHHFLVLLFITKFELTRVRGITRSAGRWLERCSAVVLLIDVWTNRVIAQDVKSCTYCSYVRCATLIVRIRGMRKSLPCTVRTSLQRTCNQRVGCLLCSVIMIYEMGLWTSARCLCLVPYCGQYGYQAQVTQHLIDSCRYNTIQIWTPNICMFD